MSEFKPMPIAVWREPKRRYQPSDGCLTAWWLLIKNEALGPNERIKISPTIAIALIQMGVPEFTS